MPDLNPRLKAQLRLAINRLKLAQQKRAALSKQSRRAIVPLLEAGKVESARIRIENIIQEDIHVELLEILEVYCELLLARASTIDSTLSIDARVKEAVYSVLYAAPHTDIKELLTIRSVLMHILTKEKYIDATENLTQQVPPKVVSRIHVGIPSEQLVTLYLVEIAKAYGATVPGIYEPPKDDEKENNTTEEDGKSVQHETTKAPAQQEASDQGKDEEPTTSPQTIGSKNDDDLWARFAALKKT